MQAEAVRQDQRYQGMDSDFARVNPDVRAGACVVMTVLLMYNSSNEFGA
jgi:hypothetical protein